MLKFGPLKQTNTLPINIGIKTPINGLFIITLVFVILDPIINRYIHIYI